MNCPKCGEKIHQGHRYCLACDYELSPEEWKAGQKKKGSGKPIVAIVVVLALVIGGGIFAAGSLLHWFAPDEPTVVPQTIFATQAPGQTLMPVITQAPIVQPTAPPTVPPTAVPTVQPVSNVWDIRSRTDAARMLMYMEEHGVNRMNIGELLISQQEVVDLVYDFTGVEEYSYILDAPTGKYMDIDWYPGMQIWHCMNNGTLSQMDGIDQEIAAWARNVVSQVIRPGMSDREKIIALHDYMIFNADYLQDESRDTHTIRGFYRYGKVQCSGYTDTFYLLGHMAGLEVKLVSGVILEDGESHAWNLVMLDGKWYAMDITWDDPIGGNAECWNYCLIPHSVFNGLRTWEPMVMPDGDYAQSLDSNWYYSYVPTAYTADEAENLLITQISANGEGLIHVGGSGLNLLNVPTHLADYFNQTVWSSYVLDTPWAQIYRISLTQ